MQKEFTVRTAQRVEFVSITQLVQKQISQTDLEEGVCIVYVPHTTAGVTINEGADPDVVRDMIMELNKMVPFEDGYLHSEGNSAAHIKTSMMGNSATVFFNNRRLVLGTWQTLYFCEFDGPRTRRVLLHIN